MAIEESIERLAMALERLTEGVETAVKALAAARAGKGAERPSKPAAAVPEASLEAPVAAAIPYSAVQAAILAHSEVRGAPATFAVLAELGVKSGKQLKPEQYAEALKKFHVEPELA